MDLHIAQQNGCYAAYTFLLGDWTILLGSLEVQVGKSITTTTTPTVMIYLTETMITIPYLETEIHISWVLWNLEKKCQQRSGICLLTSSLDMQARLLKGLGPQNYVIHGMGAQKPCYLIYARSEGLGDFKGNVLHPR